MCRLIIAGSRKFTNYALLRREVEYFIKDHRLHDIEVVSGKCPTGADFFGEVYARYKGYPIKEFPADWDAFNVAAGPIRNTEMAKYATHAIVFPLKDSRGSLDMIEKAKRHGLTLRVIRYSGDNQCQKLS
jgi:hypothetical protein